MSIQNEINRINQNIANAYSAMGNMGATLPETQNSDNMANTVRTIPQSSDGGSSVPLVYLTDEEIDAICSYTLENYLESIASEKEAF